MTPTTVFYEFLIRGDKTGALAGMHYQTRTIYNDDAGVELFEQINAPEPIAAGAEQLATILGTLNASALAQVQDLTAQLATAQAATKTAQDDAATKAATIVQLQGQLAAATAPVVPVPSAEDALLAQLNQAYDTLIPEAERITFAPVYATVRALVQAGRKDLAAGVVTNTQVPDDLAAAKAQILAALA